MKNLKSTITAFLILFTVHFFSAQEQEHKIVYQSLAWSPDGKTIAFSVIKVKPDWSDYSSDKWTLYTYDLEQKELTETGFSAIYFSFSPDGKTIAVDKNTSNDKDIFLRDLESGKETALVTDKAKDAGPSWSPDGEQIVFYSNRGGNEELYIVNVKNGETQKLTKRAEYKSYNPVWAQNSNLIVYYLEKGDSKDQIYLTDSEGSFHKNLTNDNHHNIYPSWTHDGRIIYTRDKGELMVMNSDGTGKEQFLDIPVGQVRMSPNGRFLLVSKNDGNLYTIDLSNNNEKLVINGLQL